MGSCLQIIKWDTPVKNATAHQTITVYQFIFTTDEKPTVVYSIPDRIPTTLAFRHVNWCQIDVFTLNIMVLVFSL